jgi:3-methylcrotonyl-CoA carboxylase alpha subunit
LWSDERHSQRLISGAEPSADVVKAAAAALLPPITWDPWIVLRGFRINAPPEDQMMAVVGGRVYQAAPGARAAEVVKFGDVRVLFFEGEAWPIGPPVAGQSDGGSTGDGALLAPMPGRVLLLETAQGSSVTKGQKLIVMEAMKMELVLSAPFDGVVETLKAKVGDQVAECTLLVLIGKGGS